LPEEEIVDLTTTDNMRQWMDEEVIKSHDRLMRSMITALSASVEKHLGRYVEETARTTYVDVETAGQNVIWMRGYPITTMTSIYEDSSRSYATGSLVSSSNYSSGTESLRIGRVEFDYNLVKGFEVLKVTYTGGMGTSAADFLTNFPELAHAVERQIWFDWNNRDMVGLDSLSGGQISGGNRRQVPFLTWWADWGNFIPDLVQEIKNHRSVVRRW
jgi:hypothetical protein